MKTSVIGFPRVGKLRELKFVTEKFFRGEADVAELEKTGKEIRLEQWKWQKDSRIDFIPSGIFHFTIRFWMRQFCLISFQSGIKHWDYRSRIPILRWRAVIRERRGM